MKKCVISVLVAGFAVMFSGCNKSSGEVWEDTKSIGRYLHHQGQLLWKKDAKSRQVKNEDDFLGPAEEEYIPLSDDDLNAQYVDLTVAQPAKTPGDQDSGLPNIDQFTKPSSYLANIFQTLHFDTDQHTLQTEEDYTLIDRIASYLKKQKNVYIFVEGHCDERGPEAYNLALGTRRSNTVRNLLVKKGVDPERVYAISFGKEMPIDLGHTAAAWSKNRRAEFKLYHKK